MQVLVLTPSYVPHRVISWQRAVTMYFLDKIDVIESYDDELRSPSFSMKTPAVVRLRKHPHLAKRSVKFSRSNVFTRDSFRCQYCGSPKLAKELTYDHVVPRRLGGRTNWENIVACCHPCNHRKGSRTPEQAGMKLLRRPFVPHSLPLTPPRFSTHGIPRQWAEWIQSFFSESAVA